MNFVRSLRIQKVEPHSRWRIRLEGSAASRLCYRGPNNIEWGGQISCGCANQPRGRWGALHKGTSDPKSLVRRCRRALQSTRAQRSSTEKRLRVRDRGPWIKPPASGNQMPTLEVLECALPTLLRHPTGGVLRSLEGGRTLSPPSKPGAFYFAAASSTDAARFKAAASAAIWVWVRLASPASIPSVMPGITTAA